MENIKTKIALSILAIAVIGGLIVACGGGSNTPVPTATTINGIAVPPEPDAALNNATLAGVDSNNNGVRDDVERKLANLSTNQDNFEKRIAIATEYQKILLIESTSTEAKINSVQESLQSVTCAVMKSSGSIKNELSIRDLIANNDERLKAMKSTLNIVGGFVFEPEDCK